MSITLPNDIDRTSRRPRTAIGFDPISGVEALASRARRILLVGQRRSAGTVAANVPTDLFRPTDAAGAFGDGSMIDLAARALFKANPRAQLTAVAVDDDGAGTAASQTVTFANNALVDCACTLRVGMRRITFAVVAGDQHIGRAGVAAIVQQDPETLGRDFFGEGNEFIEAATPAGDQGQPRAVVPEHAVMDVDVSYV